MTSYPPLTTTFLSSIIRYRIYINDKSDINLTILLRVCLKYAWPYLGRQYRHNKLHLINSYDNFEEKEKRRINFTCDIYLMGDLTSATFRNLRVREHAKTFPVPRHAKFIWSGGRLGLQTGRISNIQISVWIWF